MVADNGRCRLGGGSEGHQDGVEIGDNKGSE